MNRRHRSKTAARSRRLGRSGQVLIMLLVFLLPVTVITFSVYNVGVVVAAKMKLQNAADNAAYSAATYNARYMNLNAYINRTMVSNYDTMATLVALWSFVDALDGFAYLAHFIIRLIPLINALDAVFNPLHQFIHKADTAIAGDPFGVGGNKDSKRSNQMLELIEKYNSALSSAQKALFFLTQAGRGPLVQAVARGVDPKVDSWATSEFLMNQGYLNDRHRYEGSKTTKDNGEMSNADDGIRLTFERSLNFFSNGDGFRDLSPPNPIPCLKIQIGEHGFNGGGFTDHGNGTGSSQENTPKPDNKPVQIVKNTEIYQLDEGGIQVGWNCLIDFNIIDLGHKSDDQFNLPNAANESVPHVFDTNDAGDKGHSDTNIEPNMPSSGGCDNASGGLGGGGGSPPTPEEISLSQQCQSGPTSPEPGPFPPGFCAAKPLACKRVLANPPQADPANSNSCGAAGNQACDFRNCQNLADEIQAKSSSVTNNFTAATNPCATKYIFDTPLEEVEVATFKQDDQTKFPEGTRTAGPRTYIVLRRPFKNLPLLMGGDMGTVGGGVFDMEAESMAVTYYTQRPPSGTADEKKKESFWNPFWAARLEKFQPKF